VISYKALREFGREHPDAVAPLDRWYEIAEAAAWRSLADVRRDWRATDPVRVESGNTVHVFNVGGNKYRLVAAIHFDRGRVFVLRVMTHAEYDRDTWKEQL
jgi:mRNA interferase HigB